MLKDGKSKKRKARDTRDEGPMNQQDAGLDFLVEESYRYWAMQTDTDDPQETAPPPPAGISQVPY